MSNAEGGLPAEWTRTSDDRARDPAVVEYQYETPNGTRFVVSVMPQNVEQGYKLRLTTINPTSRHVRHEYPIDEYDTLEAATEEAELFIDGLTQGLRSGSISSTNPDIMSMRSAIQAFRENRSVSSISRVLRWLP